tara:strand:+ start:489 stop:1163 length:675 start_codon:yes stop_codon:yes gene_type:complete
MGKGIFITGTDTDVGKTVITGVLTKLFLNQGKKVAVYKPVGSGNKRKEAPTSPDLKVVQELSGIETEHLYSDYDFELFASPHLASEKENIQIDIEKIKKRVEELKNKYDIILIEGAGGVIVPITRTYTVLDLIKELQTEVIIVARAGLGTINHSSLTAEVLKQHHIKIKGCILNFYKGGLIEEDNEKIIQELNNIKIIGKVPENNNLNELANTIEEYVEINNLI